MSRQKALRNGLKDLVREELSQTDDDFKKKVDNIREAFRHNIGNVPGLTDCTKNLVETWKKATEQKVADIKEGRVPPHISYEDSDQSALSGTEARRLIGEMVSGMDYSVTSPHLSEWLKTVFLGNYERFLGFLHGLSEEEIKVLVSKRESLLNVPALFHVILGAREAYCSKGDYFRMYLEQVFSLELKDGHMNILIKLLSLGADVNAKDVAGRTPLDYCTSYNFNDVTLMMAEKLIRAGADVNAQDRFGKTALFNSVLTGCPTPVKLLIDHGADPYIKENEGKNTLHTFAPPCIKDVLGEYEKKRAMEERKLSRHAAGGSFRQCGVCGNGVGEKVMKRCSGCYLYWYCGRQCQVNHWPQH